MDKGLLAGGGSAITSAEVVRPKAGKARKANGSKPLRHSNGHATDRLEQRQERSARHGANDIKPQTPVSAFKLNGVDCAQTLALESVAPLVGMSPTFIRKVVGSKAPLNAVHVAALLDQDAFGETFIPRSKVVDYLFRPRAAEKISTLKLQNNYSLLSGNALEQIARLQAKSVQCVVTSTPYWAMRLYEEMTPVRWSDGEQCIFGLEQTPESFVRHSVEVIFALSRVLADEGSIWWNIMDTFNTRTQIRDNAAEALRAMQGKETRSWKQYNCRRYSAGHSYLKDGEQCLIPFKIAERVSRAGLYVKSVICWAKASTLPEPQESRVSRNVEYILHISKCRAPMFQKEAYRNISVALGGRNAELEADKLSDVWTLPTSSGRDGHGAQFPLALPGRCIALSSRKGDVVLDPFVGAGTAGEAALKLGRRFIGIDTSDSYLVTSRRRLTAIAKHSATA